MATLETPAARGLSVEHIDCKLDVTYNWGYGETRKDLRALYTKATHSQWTSEETLPWHLPVDLEDPVYPDEVHPLHGSPLFSRLTKKEEIR